MNKNIFEFIALVKIQWMKKKIYCYLFKSKINYQILNSLWGHRLIWGYLDLSKFIKIFIKYYLSHGTIVSLTSDNLTLTVPKLKMYSQKHPQKIFILNTCKGFKSNEYCLTHNVSGKLAFKVS